MVDSMKDAWSTSRQLTRPGSVAAVLSLYGTARFAAIKDPTDSNLDRWGGAVDRVIATPALTPADLANKVRIMLVERRGGDGCLIAILDDLDGMARAANATGGKAVGHA